MRAVAGRQSGNISRAQLLGIGLSEGAIDRRLQRGAIVKRYPGVYAIAPARQDPQALIAAAVLAGGPTAVASHASAAFLWGFLARHEPPAEITLSTGDRRPRHILTHRCPSLQPRDITRQRGVPTTSRARTVLDMAPRLSHKQRTRLVNDQRRDGYLHLEALADILARNPLHPGTKLLRPFVEDPRSPTDSSFEDDFLAFVKTYNLPIPHTNIWLHGRKVDVFYPEANLIVELDGWQSHNDQNAFADDRERDTENLKHGLTTMRMTKDRLELTPGYEAARLMEIYRGRVG
ncbi:MAG TPA: type IV toxin-antitoxin system AbiEi family antitoxin domain-containing protein [Solirubrobacteraceae bacterium]|jgi:hypothetical protein|nr:type IV toxin-antitoxin system AbiEi family antitoxin domain-containing protein [Solirubrobacteraceae bacterium]